MSAAVKIPHTRPSFGSGAQYLLWADGVIVGYFRLFLSAHKWREYLAATTAVSTLHISHKGETVNVWHRTGGVR